MNIKAIAIEQFGAFLLTGLTFKRIRKIVELVEKRELSGNAKRQMAVYELREAGIELANWLLNLGIELAVAWLKSKSLSK